MVMAACCLLFCVWVFRVRCVLFVDWLLLFVVCLCCCVLLVRWLMRFAVMCSLFVCIGVR